MLTAETSSDELSEFAKLMEVIKAQPDQPSKSQVVSDVLLAMLRQDPSFSLYHKLSERLLYSGVPPSVLMPGQDDAWRRYQQEKRDAASQGDDAAKTSYTPVSNRKAVVALGVGLGTAMLVGAGVIVYSRMG